MTTTSRLRHHLALTVGAVVVAGVVAVAIIVPLTTGGSNNPPPVHHPHGLRVMPFPGTLAASSRSQVMFSSLRPAQIRSVSVTGSTSGAHTGRLTAMPLHRGTSFTPRVPFAAGEHVTVRARLSSAAAGTAVGAPNSTHITFGFTVATPRDGDVGATSASTSSTVPGQRFHSVPNFHPPVVSTTPDPDPSAGQIFVTPNNGEQEGPTILNSQGKVVWFHQVPRKDEATDLAVQRYHGKPVLTWWQGVVVAGRGEGQDMVVDTSYRPVAVVRAGEGYDTDLHEFKITPQGTAFLTSFNAVKANLTAVGGKADGSVFDCIVQEIDIATGKVLWEWHALGHVPVGDSYMGTPPSTTPYDYFHINAIQELPNGNLLVTARNTWGVYEIDRATGRIIWQLGGKQSSFKFGQGAQFFWEHDAELQPNGTMTIFDDADTPKEEKESRAIVLKLDQRTMTASLQRSYTHNPSVLAGSQGNMQMLPNGNVFVGWGSISDFSEYSSGGRQIFNGRFISRNLKPGAYPVASFRAYRFHWHARPTQPPAVTVTRGKGNNLTVYVSWNGATDVASWELLAGSSPSSLSRVGTTRTQGFETAIHTTTSEPYLAVKALSKSGAALGTSSAIHG